MDKYADKLKDSRWINLGKRIRKDRNNICLSCYSHKAKTHLHHLFYDMSKEPWDYKDSDFVLLCEDCHAIEHNRLESYVGQDRDYNLRKMGFMAKDFESVQFFSYLIKAGEATYDDAVKQCLLGIKKRQDNYMRVVNLSKQPGYYDE